MKQFLFLLFIIAASRAITAGESKEISAIRAYYSDTMKKIQSETLYQRELRIAYPVIPGVGPTSSKIRIYYDMPEGREGNYEYRIIRVENFYQHTVKAYYEEYLFQPDGGLAFYFGRRGTGDIISEDFTWSYDERFYYRNGQPVRIMYDSRIIDRPSAVDSKRADVRARQARQIYSKYTHISFPPPVVFCTD